MQGHIITVLFVFYSFFQVLIELKTGLKKKNNFKYSGNLKPSHSSNKQWFRSQRTIRTFHENRLHWNAWPI